MLSTIWSWTTSTCGFVRRHKKMVLFGSAVVGIGSIYYTTRKLLQEAEAWSQEFQQQLQDQQRMTLHLQRSKQECETAFFRFLPSVRDQIKQLIPMESLVEELRQLGKKNRQARNLKWEELKEIGLVRYLTGIYAFCLLHALIHIQLHILGREAFEEAHESIVEEKQESDQNAKHEFLSSTIEYFLTQGLPLLIEHVRTIVVEDAQVKTWKVSEKTKVEPEELKELLTRLHEQLIPMNGMNDPKFSQWSTFIIYPEKQENTKNAKMMELLKETWDILDSPYFADTLNDVLSCLFRMTWENFQQRMFAKDALPPLANVIPKLKTEVGHLLTEFNDTTNAQKYCKVLMSLETLNGLCEHIFVQGRAIDWSML